VAIEVLSPTTGIVIEIKTQVGSRVESESELIIIESMKMHIPVTAPAAGVVESLVVGEGDAVSEDDLVATLVEG
jgi:biotin carboxyl carrier protein